MSIHCPKCGVTESHSTDSGKVMIRAFKVFDDKGAWSQCLVCSGYYHVINYFNAKNQIRSKFIETPDQHVAKLGWFVS